MGRTRCGNVPHTHSSVLPPKAFGAAPREERAVEGWGTSEQKSPSSPRPAPTVGPRLWAKPKSQRHRRQEGVRLLQHVVIFSPAPAGPSDTAALRPSRMLLSIILVWRQPNRKMGTPSRLQAGRRRRGCARYPRALAGLAEATVAGGSDLMGGISSAAQSDLGGDDFKPASAPKMVFCTAGLKRLPKCPPCSKTVNCSGPNVAWSQARSSSARRKSF